jgi:hypothetical protein
MQALCFSLLFDLFVLKVGLTPFGCFSPKRRFENQKPTKTKKQALCFSLLFDLFVHNVVQLSNFFLKDLEKLREFTETYKNHKLFSLS